MRLFNYYDVAHAELLFCPWDEYYSRVKIGTPVAAAARARMDQIYNAWLYCVQRTLSLKDTVYTLWVGFFLDSHVAIASVSAEVKVHEMFRRALTPEQTTLALQVQGPLLDAVDMLWGPAVRPLQTPLEKLIVKGKPNPLSVRYIRPQIVRCGACTQSKAAVLKMLRRWMLGMYQHRTIVVSPEKRLRIWAMSFEEISTAVIGLPSRALYNVVAECIAACTLQSPAKHIRAAGTTVQFAQFAAAACGFAESPVNRGSTITYTASPPIVLEASAISRWPLSAATTARQIQASQQYLGLQCINTFVCHHCNSLHIKSNRQPRAAKARVGVSFDISDPSIAWCNKCDNRVALVPLTGYMTRAKVGKEWKTATICCGCAATVTAYTNVGENPHCASCYASAMSTMRQEAVCCPCGSPKQSTDRLTVMLNAKHEAIIAHVCDNHAHLVQHENALPIQTWQQLFAVAKL